MRTIQQADMGPSTRPTIRALILPTLDPMVIQFSRRVNMSTRMAKSGRGEEGHLQRAWLAAGVLLGHAMGRAAVDYKELLQTHSVLESSM
jgi:hypothetical protein